VEGWAQPKGRWFKSTPPATNLNLHIFISSTDSLPKLNEN